MKFVKLSSGLIINLDMVSSICQNPMGEKGTMTVSFGGMESFNLTLLESDELCRYIEDSHDSFTKLT